MRWGLNSLKNLSKGILAVFLFILAIQLMKAGAFSLGPFLNNFNTLLSNPLKTLSVGWLASYLILSGSPIAAMALVFFEAGVISELETFTMIMGSRFGAEIIVIMVGLIAIFRGENRSESLSTGVIAFLVTYSIHIPAAFLGYLMIYKEMLSFVKIGAPPFVLSFIDVIYTPVVEFLLNHLPAWINFLLSLGIIYLSFELFDRAIPKVRIDETRFRKSARHLGKPIVSFFLGAVITTFTMSVSISMSVLVPLFLRGYIKRREIVPYMIGANIMTFIDTLIIAILLENPTAVIIVLAELVGVALISLPCLVFYDKYYFFIENLTEHILKSTRRVVLFMLILFIIPIVLILG
ncbi:MAG: hypothetical protein ACE5K0_09190 [Candidatus Methanofastidiosia archaeon]